MKMRSMAPLPCQCQAGRHLLVQDWQSRPMPGLMTVCCVLLRLLPGVVSRREIWLALLRQHWNCRYQRPAAACRWAWEPSSPWPRRELP